VEDVVNIILPVGKNVPELVVMNMETQNATSKKTRRLGLS